MDRKLAKLQDKLQAQVQKEYELGFNHIRTERDRKRDIMQKVLDTTLEEGRVRVNLLWRNIQLEEALFLNDEISIRVLMEDGVIGEEMMEQANKVLKFDDIEMGGREMREMVINHNALYGVSVSIIDAWDSDENAPLSEVVDPLACIFDPQNYSGSKMRFFGIERRVSREYLDTMAGYDTKDIAYCTNSELARNKRSSDQANNLREVACDDGMVDIYDHFTTYDGMKWLTTWASDRSVLLRAVEIEPLTMAEKKNPRKCKFPVQLHRRKPKLGSPFGVSIADEVLSFQDNISKLSTLQMIQASQMAL
jgi:hypothetical protein